MALKISPPDSAPSLTFHYTRIHSINMYSQMHQSTQQQTDEETIPHWKLGERGEHSEIWIAPFRPTPRKSCSIWCSILSSPGEICKQYIHKLHSHYGHSSTPPSSNALNPASPRSAFPGTGFQQGTTMAVQRSRAQCTYNWTTVAHSPFTGPGVVLKPFTLSIAATVEGEHET